MLPAVGEVDSIVDTPGSTWLLKIHVFPGLGQGDEWKAEECLKMMDQAGELSIDIVEAKSRCMRIN